jgi:hypothetical protein
MLTKDQVLALKEHSLEAVNSLPEDHPYIHYLGSLDMLCDTAIELLAALEKRSAGDFVEPIIGQEAIVPEYGVGRVISFENKMPNTFIEVRPYACDYPMKFDPKNVQLISINTA